MHIIRENLNYSLQRLSYFSMMSGKKNTDYFGEIDFT